MPGFLVLLSQLQFCACSNLSFFLTQLIAVFKNSSRFPLFGLIGVALLLVSASELYAFIFLVNSLLLLFSTLETSDFVLWFLVYELSVITGISALTLESRSFRRIYAFFVMFGVTALASICLYVLVNFSRWEGWTAASSVVLLLGCSVLILVKIPSFPFSVWLPEAHVEASWAGSIVLAAYALKFAVIASSIFLVIRISTLDLVVGLILLSIFVGALAMAATVDAKKLIANFSIVHMGATTAILVLSTSAATFLNFSWHHHSLLTGAVFGLIGAFYAISGTRLIRFLVGHSGKFLLAILIFFAIVSFSADLPWTSNIFVELNFVRQFGISISIFCSLLISFWVIFLLVFAIWNGRSARQLSSTSDSPLGLLVLSTVLSIATATLGFGSCARDCSRVWLRGSAEALFGPSAGARLAELIPSKLVANSIWLNPR